MPRFAAPLLAAFVLTGCCHSAPPTTRTAPTADAAPDATTVGYAERVDARDDEVMGTGHISPISPTVLPLVTVK